MVSQNNTDFKSQVKLPDDLLMKECNFTDNIELVFTLVGTRICLLLGTNSRPKPNFYEVILYCFDQFQHFYSMVNTAARKLGGYRISMKIHPVLEHRLCTSSYDTFLVLTSNLITRAQTFVCK